MSIDDAVARWSPSLDPNYGSWALTDLIGGVGNFTLPANDKWATDGTLKHLGFGGSFGNWTTFRVNGPVQSRLQSFTFSYWSNVGGGIHYSMLSRSSTTWNGWYANRSVANNVFENQFGSLAPVGFPVFSGWRQMVLRQLAGTFVVYSVNGLHHNPSTTISNIVSGQKIQLALGASVRQNGNADNFFAGLLDDVIFWDRYLSDDEIVALYQVGRAGNLSITTQTRRRRELSGAGL